MEKQKKSAIDLTDLALGIVVLGIVVSIGAVILTNMRDARLTDLPVDATVVNITGSNTTGTSLGNPYFKSLTSLVNATNTSQVVPASNYTITTADAVTGNATLTINGATWNGKSMTVTYDSYDTTQADYASANDAATGLGEYGNWFKIIVIVGVAAVILALIFMAFGRGAGSVGSQQSY
jgi:hypothetical protein